MAIQKTHHDLVILDENNEPKSIDIKKLIVGGLLFVSGIFIGTALVSIFDTPNELVQKEPLASTNKPIVNAPLSILSITEDNSTDLQSITANSAESAAGCGIESLEEDSQGCSVDAFTEVPADINETGLTDLNQLISPESQINETIPIEDSTNILDLQ